MGRRTRGGSYHKIPIERALAEGFIVFNDDGELLTAADLLADCNDDPDLFAQEYQCSFMASSMRFIAARLWDDACYDPETEAPTGVGQGVYGGMDVGAGGHESTIVDFENNSGVLWQLEDVERKRDPDMPNQEEWARSGMKRRRRFAVDGTGLGIMFGQRLEQAFPGVAESVPFTVQNKEILVSTLSVGLKRKIVRPRSTDIATRRDVLSIRREITEFGNIRVHAKDTAKAHADGAWSVALAVHASDIVTKERAVTTKVSTPKATEISGPRQKRGAWR